MPLSNRQKVTMIVALKKVWNDRDIPAIEDAILFSLTDHSLTDLCQFWAHKNRHWVDASGDLSRQPRYNPPVAPEVPVLSGRVVGRGASNPKHRAFFTPGGGSLAARMRAKMGDA